MYKTFTVYWKVILYIYIMVKSRQWTDWVIVSFQEMRAVLETMECFVMLAQTTIRQPSPHISPDLMSTACVLHGEWGIKLTQLLVILLSLSDQTTISYTALIPISQINPL